MRQRWGENDESAPIYVQRGYTGYWGHMRMEADHSRAERRYGQAADGRRSVIRPPDEDQRGRFRAAWERYMADLDRRIAELERMRAWEGREG